MSRSITHAALALSLFCAGACTVVPKGHQNTYTGAEHSHEMGAIEGNSDLANRLEIQNPRSRRLEDGRLEIQFDLVNTRSTITEFAYALDWFDESGFQLQSNTRHFEPKALGGGAVITISAVGPTVSASSWRLHVTNRNEVQ